MNFIKNVFVHESAPNRGSRPLNTQLTLEISIHIQWKTSRPKKINNHKKNPLFWVLMLGLSRQSRLTTCKTNLNRSEGFALTGYDIPGCVEDGAWMLWENSSVAVVVVVAVAHLGLRGGARIRLFPRNQIMRPAGRMI